MIRCFTNRFYIKPQLVGVIDEAFFVALLIVSTSNRNTRTLAPFHVEVALLIVSTSNRNSAREAVASIPVALLIVSTSNRNQKQTEKKFMMLLY